LADNEKEMLAMKQSYEEKLAQAQAEVFIVEFKLNQKFPILFF
jgi:hypothetical protein